MQHSPFNWQYPYTFGRARVILGLLLGGSQEPVLLPYGSALSLSNLEDPWLRLSIICGREFESLKARYAYVLLGGLEQESPEMFYLLAEFRDDRDKRYDTTFFRHRRIPTVHRLGQFSLEPDDCMFVLLQYCPSASAFFFAGSSLAASSGLTKQNS